MVRVKGGFTTRRRHNKILKKTKGYKGLRSRIFVQAKNAWMKAGLHAYRNRRLKKRDYRSLWITRISAALKMIGLNYSRFINNLETNDVLLNRKVLADLAASHPQVFNQIADKVSK